MAAGVQTTVRTSAEQQIGSLGISVLLYPEGLQNTSVCGEQVSEGLEVLDAINEAIVDDKGRPLQNIRIRHTIVLEDPFPDPPQLADHIPEASPEPVFAAVNARGCHITQLTASSLSPHH